MFFQKNKKDNKSHKIEEAVLAACQASAWCGLNWDSNRPRSSLRTLEFSPEFFGTDHYYTVDSIIHARRHKLESMKVKIPTTPEDGDILIYKPDESVFDGMSEYETDGYVDVNDCPPWDTWIGYIAIGDERFVLSWVPRSIVSLVNDGIEVNCVECFYWLRNSNEEWAKKLANEYSKL